MPHVVQLSGFGAPDQVVQINQIAALNPGPGQVVIDLEYANINPSDCLTVRGLYGILPKTFPATLGNEGVGRIRRLGDGVPKTWQDRRVALPLGAGVWADQILTRADTLLPLPDHVPGEQLAMALVNPPTAYLLLTSICPPAPGGWVIQNAGNSSVGQAAHAFAKDLDLNLISLVRSHRAAAALPAHAHAFQVNDPELKAKIRALIGNDPLTLALDAIGGEATMTLADLLSPGGTLICYGALSGQACKLAPQQAIFKGISLRGFWLVNWFNKASQEDLQAMSQRVGAKITDGSLAIEVEATYPLDQAVKALKHAEQPGRRGKILFRGSGAA